MAGQWRRETGKAVKRAQFIFRHWPKVLLLFGRDKFLYPYLEVTGYERLVLCSDNTEAAIVNGSCRFLKLTWGPYSVLSFTPASETENHFSGLYLGRLWIEWRFTCPSRKTEGSR